MLLDENKYKCKFDLIFLWSTTFFHDSKWRNIDLPPGSVFTTFNEAHVKQLHEQVESINKLGQVNVLFIFDDMITEGIMNSRRIQTLEAIAVRGRHYNLSIIIISQQYMALSPPIRNNATNSIFFRIRNGKELSKVCDENCESLSVNQFFDIYNHATSQPFSFLHINNQKTNPAERFWKNWNTLLLLDGSQLSSIQRLHSSSETTSDFNNT